MEKPSAIPREMDAEGESPFHGDRLGAWVRPTVYADTN